MIEFMMGFWRCRAQLEVLHSTIQMHLALQSTGERSASRERALNAQTGLNIIAPEQLSKCY